MPPPSGRPALARALRALAVLIGVFFIGVNGLVVWNLVGGNVAPFFGQKPVKLEDLSSEELRLFCTQNRARVQGALLRAAERGDPDEPSILEDFARCHGMDLSGSDFLPDGGRLNGKREPM